MATTLWSIALVITAATLGSFGPILLKKASKDLTFNIKTIISNKYLLGGLVFYGIGTVLFIPALKGGELSVLYPLVATTYVWVSLLSVKFLKEKMNAFKWIGVFLIIIGVALVGLGA